MSMLREVKTNVLTTNVFVYNSAVPGPTAEGAYEVGSVWPRFRGATNDNYAQSSVTGPALGAGVVTSDGFQNYSETCPVVNAAGNVFVITQTGIVKKFNAVGNLLYTGSTPGALTATRSMLVIAKGGLLYFSAREGTYKVEDTGTTLIQTQISSIGYDGMLLITGNGNIIIGTLDGVYCLSPAGAVVWHNSTVLGVLNIQANVTDTSATGWNLGLDINTNLLYVYTCKFMYVLNGGTGETVHREILGFNSLNPPGAWSAPVVGPSYVYVGTSFGLCAFTKAGTLAWTNRDINQCFKSSPAYNADLNIVYVGTYRHMLCGVNGTTGALVFATGEPPGVVFQFNQYESPIIDADGSVYVYSKEVTNLGNKGLYKFTAAGVYVSKDLFTTTFAQLALGPNGKIYMATGNGLKITA